MNPQLRHVHENIRTLGLNALAHANWHAHYMHDNDATSELSVLQAAHAAELLIKARIAQEHPLLIFDQLPKTTQSVSGLLDFSDLVAAGRTLDYTDLPSRLWAATGMTLPGLELFRRFGKLRNAIQHFAPPRRIGDEVSQFIYGVIDPFINSSWGLYAIDFNEDSEPHTYLMATLVQREILFLPSPEAATAWKRCREHLDLYRHYKPSSRYTRELLRRIRSAAKMRKVAATTAATKSRQRSGSTPPS